MMKLKEELRSTVLNELLYKTTGCDTVMAGDVFDFRINTGNGIKYLRPYCDAMFR